ncbi:MAG: hypothetical protein Q9217_006899 [Psora testacea]
MATSKNSLDEDDSEWEYEYHDTETESFYVTLDISSAASQFRPKQLRPATMNTQAQPTSNTPSEPPIDPLIQSAPQADTIQSVPPLENDSQPQTSTVSGNFIQILDLHTTNPLISYQNQLYSCTWGSTIGTDVLITAQHPVSNNAHGSPKPSSPKASVLATTSIKLSGRPVQAVARPKPELSGQLLQAATLPSGASASTGNTNPSTSAKFDIGDVPSRARQEQAAFLERLSEIRAAKGEKDNVRVQVQPRAQQAVNGDSNRNCVQSAVKPQGRVGAWRGRRGAAKRKADVSLREHIRATGGSESANKRATEGAGTGNTWRQKLTGYLREEGMEVVDEHEPGFKDAEGDAVGDMDVEMEDA